MVFSEPCLSLTSVSMECSRYSVDIKEINRVDTGRKLFGGVNSSAVTEKTLARSLVLSDTCFGGDKKFHRGRRDGVQIIILATKCFRIPADTFTLRGINMVDILRRVCPCIAWACRSASQTVVWLYMAPIPTAFFGVSLWEVSIVMVCFLISSLVSSNGYHHILIQY